MDTAWWKNVWGTNGNDSSQSNYPTQQSVQILDQVVGDFPIGTVIICFSDLDVDVPSSGCVRRYFYLTPGAMAFQLLTEWVPAGQYPYENKGCTSSFVICGGKICAVTDKLGAGQTYFAFNIIYGEYDLSQGAGGDWVETDLAVCGTNVHDVFFYPDIAISDDGCNAIVCWTQYNYSTEVLYQYFKGAIRSSPNVAWTWRENRAEQIWFSGANPKSSVIWKEVGTFYLHGDGYVRGGSGTSNLYTVSSQGGGMQHKVVVNLPEAAICNADNGFLGIMGIASNYFYIAQYSPGTGLIAAEGLIAASGSYRYAITCRGGLYQILIYSSATAVVELWRMVAGEEGEQPYYIESLAGEVGYYGEGLDYYSVCRDSVPGGVEPDYFGFIGMRVSGARPYTLYYRGSGEVSSTIPEGNYWDKIFYGAAILECDLDGKGIAYRGNEKLAPVDSVVLADRRVLLIEHDKIYQFDPSEEDYNAYLYGTIPDTFEIETPKFPSYNGWYSIEKVKLDIELSDGDSCELRINANDSFTQSVIVTSEMKNDWIQMGVSGNYFSCSVIHSGASKFSLNRITVDIQRLQE